MHFPGAPWLVAQAALAQYNLRNFDESQALYEDLVERDPYRIEVPSPSGPQSSRIVFSSAPSHQCKSQTVNHTG